MTQIICLANSWKYGDRCIAGIELTTGKWLRPISDLSDGRILWCMRLVDGEEPALLDIIDLPLADNAPSQWQFERENRTLLPGAWQRVGQVPPTDLLPFCHDDQPILHNGDRSVSLTHLLAQPLHDRSTLQLVYVQKLSVQRRLRMSGRCKWQAILLTTTGQLLPPITITDPVFVERLESGYRPHNPCLVTISLSLPFHPDPTEPADDPCWKLIAGVIELTNTDLILVEMKRLGWTLNQGREFLQQHYGKRSRKQLSMAEVNHFLSHLQSLLNQFN